jgi:uncharacterized membrane protein
MNSRTDEPLHHPEADVGSADRRLIRRLLLVGFTMAVVEVSALGVLWFTDRKLFLDIMTVVGAAFFGGRMPGILAGLGLRLGSLATSTINILLNTCWLLLALPVFQRATTQATSSPWLRRFFRGAETSAQRQTRRVSKLGLVGLVLFVWLPIPGTGAFVGALIGMIMGVPLGRLVPLLLASMWVGVVSWTYGIEFVFLFTGPAGHTAAWIITGLFFVYAIATRLRRAPESADG